MGEEANQPSVRRRIGEIFARSRGSSETFDRFTDRARRVLALAQEEAQRLNHNYIGTEHLLLGLVRESESVAGRVLSHLGVQLPAVREAVLFVIGRGEGPVAGEIGLTPRAKKVMELAVDEARRLRHDYIGTEHLLLGLVREGEGVAAGVLTNLGLDLEQVRAHVLVVIGTAGGRPVEEPAATRGNVVTCRIDMRDLVAIDTLVEAGIRGTRSEAAAWLIHAGIEANQALFTQVNATVAEIRRLRGEAQAVANQLAASAGTAEPPPTADTPPAGGDPPARPPE
jgi:ATP-dependent Clp protease ATP-binding subunit ClpC